ncbi:MAG: hypothetical protein HQ530_04915 [Parcubacteria group bacterium]|nr:hypothetical protein [Parcubacteria group bacterium]
MLEKPFQSSPEITKEKFPVENEGTIKGKTNESEFRYKTFLKEILPENFIFMELTKLKYRE